MLYCFAGLMSVTAQHLDYLRTALRTLDASSENQYKIRGQPRSDKVRSLASFMLCFWFYFFFCKLFFGGLKFVCFFVFFFRELLTTKHV